MVAGAVFADKRFGDYCRQRGNGLAVVWPRQVFSADFEWHLFVLSVVPAYCRGPAHIFKRLNIWKGERLAVLIINCWRDSR